MDLAFRETLEQPVEMDVLRLKKDCGRGLALLPRPGGGRYHDEGLQEDRTTREGGLDVQQQVKRPGVGREVAARGSQEIGR